MTATLATSSDAGGPRVLMVTVALGGFATYYRPLLRTHASYAASWHHIHRVIKRPTLVVNQDEAAWSKVLALRAGLDAGYDVVVTLDADILLRPSAPAITDMLRPGKSIYMARGASGHVNSGFVVLVNDDHASDFVDDVLARADHPAPAEYRTPYENGHMIERSMGDPTVEVIDQRWNNSIDRELDDWGRHFTNVLKGDYEATRARELAWRALREARELRRHHLPPPSASLGQRLQAAAPSIRRQLDVP